MKKVLIIANLFHASPRIPGFTTYLPEFGWEATLVTPPIGNDAENRFGFPKKFLERTKIVEVPYRGDIFWFWRRIFKLFGFKTNESITEQVKEQVGITSKKSFIDLLMNWYQAIWGYPDAEKTWKKPALKAASKILKIEHFDAILSSSPYPTNHIVAAELKKRFNLYWLADFRDPWTQSHYYLYGFIRRYFEGRLEQKILSSADAIVAAAPAYAKKQKYFHKRTVIVITNGFDPENLENSRVSLTKKFTITYTGQIITGKQDPEKVLVSLKKLISQKIINDGDIEIRFYGRRENWLTNRIIKYGLSSMVQQYGAISRYESLQKQKESHILLLLNWEDPKEKGVYPTKFFEYLSAQRPILASGGFFGNDIEKILIETKTGIYASTAEEIEIALLNYYGEYKRTGRVSYNGDLREISKYSYPEMAKKFADILDQITNK